MKSRVMGLPPLERSYGIIIGRGAGGPFESVDACKVPVLRHRLQKGFRRTAEKRSDFDDPFSAFGKLPKSYAIRCRNLIDSDRARTWRKGQEKLPSLPRPVDHYEL